MKLYLLRHGIAADLGQPGITRDADRPLTDEGISKTKRIGAALRSLAVECDLILTSPYVRARQTAELVASALCMERRLEEEPALACGGDARQIFEGIRRRKPVPAGVMLVGHEPDLSRLISLLVSGGTGLGVVMKKGGLCRLDIADLRYGRCAALEWLLTPRQMLLMR